METLDKHFRKLTGPVFQKHGFAQGDVLSHWPTIVGAQIAAITMPEKIRWPRGQEEKQGGTLHLKVQAGRGLDVQYASAAVLEKINGFLGYQALSAIKLIQDHNFQPQVKATRPVPAPTASVLARVAPVSDSDLKAALARLGAGISAPAPRSPQAK